MKIYEIISEAMPPSLYRGFTKKWNKEYLRDIFQNSPYKKDRNAYRLYLPFEYKEDTETPVEIPIDIQQEVEKQGYKIVDYKGGYAERDGRKVRLGRILPPVLKQKFENDPARTGVKLKKFMIAISRHPYDIGGMSTDRGWKSCQTLPVGSECKYVPVDISEGSIIAYLIRTNDPNIEHPAARILIKPYVRGKNMAYGSTNRVYGDLSDEQQSSFIRETNKFVNWLNKQIGAKGEFTLSSRVYTEGPKKIFADLPDMSEDEIIELIHKNRDDVESIIQSFIGLDVKLTKKIQLAAVSQHGWVIGGIIEAVGIPSEEVQIAAVSQSGEAIRYIIEGKITPSSEVQIAAVSQSGWAIRHIFDAVGIPSEEVQIAAVSQDGGVIWDIILAGVIPSEEVQIAAVSQDGWAIRDIIGKGITPSEDVRVAALKNTNNPYILTKIYELLKQKDLVTPRVEAAYREVKQEKDW